jgi:hypothetical protein
LEVSSLKNKISLFIAVITLSVIFNLLTQTSSEAAAIGCLKTADGTAIKVTAQANMFALAGTTTYDQNQCSQEPDEYKVTFYKVALCTADPYKGAADPDFSTCSNIFNNAAGTEQTIKPDEETDLLSGDLVLPIGTYPYLVVMVNNHLNIKHKQKYVLADGTTNATFYGNDTGSGTYCWTITAVTTYTNYIANGEAPNWPETYDDAHGVTLLESGSGTTNARLKCGSAVPADFDASTDSTYIATEIIDDLADDPDNEDFQAKFGYDDNDVETETGVSGIEMAQNLLQDDGVTLATSGNNAKRLLSHFKYASPVVISENTVGFKMRFSTYSAVSIDMASDGTGETFKMWGAKVGADPFMVQIQTKKRRRATGSTGDWR